MRVEDTCVRPLDLSLSVTAESSHVPPSLTAFQVRRQVASHDPARGTQPAEGIDGRPAIRSLRQVLTISTARLIEAF
jgi:hypothetical protein